MIKSSFILKVIKFVLKYLLPVVCGYLEGDSHAVENTISTLF